VTQFPANVESHSRLETLYASWTGTADNEIRGIGTCIFEISPKELCQVDSPGKPMLSSPMYNCKIVFAGIGI
jgi:hypothetical protein